ncbi:MAG: alpha-L-fucosidase [Muribaculaceae bacterium]|nr:alpha-L-fucosidase [Muribaculaceae bacterium]
MKKIKLLLSLAALLLSPFAKADEIPFAQIIKIEPGDTEETVKAKAAHVIPNENQANSMDNDFIAFIHFGPNTFSGREWGTGMEDPTLFNPPQIDADQWVKAIKDAGMTKVILTVKHHDGYVLYQTRYTDHGIMQSPYMNGQGDVFRDLAKACEKYGIKLGVYLSPADLYQIESPDGLYGNGSQKTMRTIPREVEGRPFANPTKFEFEADDYNEYFMNQLFELLTEYGPIHEVWFDGAKPKDKGGQTYNYDAWLEMIRTLAPEAVVFGAGEVRWCGNEAGETRDTEWNVVPYQEDPSVYTPWGLDQNADIGSIDMLKNAKYLKYVYPETDTSIRDGWFYRDENQGVRSADDVYDIYERAAGGNSVLLLNIPPNKEGRFSDRDVEVLAEVGRRIRATYTDNLLSKSNAPKELLDNDKRTGIPMNGELVIEMPEPITFNRFMLQEQVPVTGERIASHALDAFINGEWVEIANATNVGNKRILRFPDVTTDKVRVRVLDSRLEPVLATVGAYFYPAHAPQLSISRDNDGMVSIEPKASDFQWKNALKEAAKNLSQGTVIHYTLDGSEPDASSPVYTEPFLLPNQGEVKAKAYLNDTEGPVADRKFGYGKKNWKVVDTQSANDRMKPEFAIDSNPATFWASTPENMVFTVDMGETLPVKAFTYTPQTRFYGEGMIEQGVIEASTDGKKWQKVAEFNFGNLINDPTPRTLEFGKPVKARYVRVTPQRLAGEGKNAAIAEIDLY